MNPDGRAPGARRGDFCFTLLGDYVTSGTQVAVWRGQIAAACRSRATGWRKCRGWDGC